MISLTLPVPPSLNHYLKGRVYKTKEAKDYVKLVQWTCRAEGITRPTDKPIKLTMRWYPKAHQGDLDNRIKVLQDSLEHFAYKNDSQVVEIHAYRMPVDKKNPRVEIEIEAI